MIVWAWIKRRMYRVMMFGCVLSFPICSVLAHHATIPVMPWIQCFKLSGLVCGVCIPFFGILGAMQDWIDMNRLKRDILRKLES